MSGPGVRKATLNFEDLPELTELRKSVTLMFVVYYSKRMQTENTGWSPGGNRAKLPGSPFPVE